MSAPTAIPAETRQHTDPSPYTPANNTLRYHFEKDDHNRDNYSADIATPEAAIAAFEQAYSDSSIDGKMIRSVAIVAGGRRRKVQGGEKEILEGGKQLAAWSKEGGLHAPDGWQSGLKGEAAVADEGAPTSLGNQEAPLPNPGE